MRTRHQSGAALRALSCSFVVIATASVASATGYVAGNLITLTNTSTAPNGAWSWFEDERAIIDNSDPNNTLLLVSSVSAGGGGERGDIDLLWLNIDTGQQGEFELNDTLEQDDHNSAALWRRPDGRYVAAYGRHNTDRLMRYRVSTNPNDPTSWGSEIALDAGGNATYNNLHYLPNDRGGQGRLYNFTRTANFDPNIIVSNDHGSTWTYGGKLLTQGGGTDRPYLKYTTIGDRVHFIATQTHPRNNFNNSVFHGYVEDGQLFDAGGALLDGNLLDGAGVAPSSLTTVFAAGSNIGSANNLNRAWTIDLDSDANGNPVAIMSARVNNSEFDHRFLYGTFDGSDWTVHEIAKAGAFLYPQERDYTGLISIDPDDTNVLYMSSDIDPRTGESMPHYEIFRGETADGGANWDWDAITFASTVDNLRPLVPASDGDSGGALVWLRGNYNTFSDWDTEVVALTDLSSIPTGVSFADLNGDEVVDRSDVAIFMANHLTDLSGLSPSEAAARGDLNGDLRNDFADFRLLRGEYQRLNGQSTFAQALAIPEPAGVSLLLLAVAVVRGQKRG